MRIDIISVLPELMESSFQASILKRAAEKGLVEVHFHQLRNSVRIFFEMKIRSGSIRRLYWWDFRGALRFYNLFPPCCISFLSPVPPKARTASLRLHW